MSGVINQDFYNLNGSRGYPLDDRATRTGDNGERMPHGIIVDLNMRFPKHLGEYAWLSAVAVTPTMVTATFLACPDPDAGPASFVPLAAVTARRPVASGQAIALDALCPGVGGWIVFGPADELFKAKFSSPRQGLLLSRCARPTRPLPVEAIRKMGVAAGLTGVVTLKGNGDIEVVPDIRRVDGISRNVIVVRLRSFASSRNVFDLYKGPCGGRPESNTCDRPGVEFLNTVAPDCDGNITLTFTGDTEVIPYTGSSEGLVLNHMIGLTEACTKRDRLPDAVGRLPTEYDDICTTPYEGQIIQQDSDSLGEDRLTFDVPYTSSEVISSPPLPYLEEFTDSDAENWRTLIGLFEFSGDDDSSTSSAPGVSDRSYEAKAPTRNVAIWDTHSTTTTVNKRVTVDLRLTDIGGASNGGIVLSYHTIASPLHDEYIVAEIDQATDSLRLRWWNGGAFQTLGEVIGVGLTLYGWHRLVATVVPSGPNTRITVDLLGLTHTYVSASLVVETNRYLTTDGRFGLATDQAVTRFDSFRLEEV